MLSVKLSQAAHGLQQIPAKYLDVQPIATAAYQVCLLVCLVKAVCKGFKRYGIRQATGLSFQCISVFYYE